MIGIVIVSHSARLAEGVLELARGMAGPEVKLAAAGGLALPDHPLGTDACSIARAIEQVYSTEGVVVLMDLGSAVLNSEMALEMLAPEKRAHVALCEAPLVEGAVAAAVQARLGGSLEQVITEARGALASKADHLSDGTAPAGGATATTGPGARMLRLTVTNRLGLHARPAARFVQTAGRFPETEIAVANVSAGRGPVNAKSINSVTTLGVRQGHTIEITAAGPQAEAALAALQELAQENFGDDDRTAVPPEAASSPATAGDASPCVDHRLTGLPGSEGIAIGPACHFRPAVPEIPAHMAAEPAKEWAALMEAIEKTREDIRSNIAEVTRRAGKEAAAIFEAHLLFLDDEALLAPARRLIYEENQNSAAAWHQVVENMAAGYRTLDDEYLRERAADVIDVGRQVLTKLLGTTALVPVLSVPGVLVAPDLTPADTVRLDPSRVRGICTASGGPTSHSVIMSKTFGIPSVVGLGEAILKIEEGTPLIVDGERGEVFVNPDDETKEMYTRRMSILAEEEAKNRALSYEPAITRDGRKLEIAANIGSVAEARRAAGAGAEGVGLFRTELLFLDRMTPPDEDEQFDVYCAAAQAMEGRPVIVRTLDAGGDKHLPYLDLSREANPFLGQRAVRLCLARPDFFKVQLRAIVRAACRYPLKIMFPMVATLEELRLAKALLAEAVEEVRRSGEAVPERMETGIMVEVPAAALQSEKFAPEVDFFSIGTNDLTQYTMAAERGNASVAGLADHLQPAVLKLIRLVVDAANRHGKWVGVCGKAGEDPLAVPLLLGLGVQELSMTVPAIPGIKQLIRRLEYSSAREISTKALALASAQEVRKLAASYIARREA